MADPVQAVFLDSLKSLPAGNWQRLYAGAEFCPWTFPPDSDIESAFALARNHGLPLTLATPVLDEGSLPRFRHCLETFIPRFEAGDELLVSDLGGLRLARRLFADATIVVGRVLSGQKRGPRILDLELGQAGIDYFRQGSWYQEGSLQLLREYGVSRVELDNLLQGIAPLPDGLCGTLHMPYAMVTSSRNCPVRQPGHSGPCPGGCDKVFRLTTPQTSIPLYQAGNTQFLMNETLPDDLPALGIDRVVSHQRLPR